MTRQGMRWTLPAAVALGASWLLGAAAAGENAAERNRTAGDKVVRALHYEVEGKNAQRENLLQEVLEESPDYPAARWHSGQVRLNNRWVRCEDAPRVLAADERLALYRQIRGQHPDTVEGNLAMAVWCEKRKLPEQRRAHLSRVVHLDPEHAEARRLLGYRQVDGVWLAPGEVGQAAERASAAVAALREWQPKLAEIRAALGQRNPKQREAAEARLAAIQEAASVPAIELVFCAHDEPTALRGVEKLAGMAAGEASVALARQAVFSPWASVRDAAADKLKARKFETFVPALLSAMSSPIRSRIELYAAPTGRLLYRHVFFREGQQLNDLAVLDSWFRLQAYDDGGPKVRMGVRGADPGAVARIEAAAEQRDLLRQVAFEARAKEMAAAQQNAMLQEMNDRLCRVLSASTGQKLPPSADEWWRWWVHYDGVYVPEYKPTRTVHREDRRTYAYPDWLEVVPVHSCLVPGTRVWTESGPAAIEQVRVGDRVLSQHPQTGELAYKPVVAVTVREPTPLVRLQLLDDSIRCSGGHPFWIAGHGWVRARDIKPGMHFHGAAGTTPLRQSDEAAPERLHNLIVADFHSYFVGDAMVLSHDITARAPTNLRVPGLPERKGP